MANPDLGGGDFSALAEMMRVADPPASTNDSSVNDTTPLPSGAVPALNGTPPAPPEPQSLAQAGITDSDAEALLLKTLMQQGAVSGNQLAESTCLSRAIVGSSINDLREHLLVSIKASAGVNDYVFQLTEAGYERARRHAESCNYTGPAPVTLEAYAAAITRQSIQQTRLKLDKLSQALSDMTLRPEFISQIAQAINDGRGMFLHGSPGNGKTTLAERLCNAFGQYIWIPRLINIGGDLVRLYDPSCHEEAPGGPEGSARFDRRWVLIRRPTVVVGGELTLEQLDTCYNPAAGISEAPVQLKANGGALLIDDFGRQRVSSTEILNRLIVPLEKQIDFLNLSSGRQIQTPFDLLFILSTNLEPKELVDEAFLRRIPYKVKVPDPNEQEFRGLFEPLCQAMGYKLAPGVIEWLINEHYTTHDRMLRFCHPRDLLRQVKNYCEVHELPKVVDQKAMDAAVQNYFAGL